MIQVIRTTNYKNEARWDILTPGSTIRVSESDIKDLVGSLQAAIFNYHWAPMDSTRNQDGPKVITTKEDE